MNFKTLLLTTIYISLCFTVMGLVINENQPLQLYIKPFISITLFFLYFVSVKKVSPFYGLMLLCVLAGHTLVIYNKYFTSALYSYVVFHIITILFVYKDFLLKRSLFNIVTFALPFFMVFGAIFLLISDNLTFLDYPTVTIFGFVACIDGAIVLLNYAQKRDVDNYLIFVGVFAVITTAASGAIYRYAEGDIIFYQILVLLDFLGQYAICQGVIIKQKKIERGLDYYI